MKGQVALSVLLLVLAGCSSNTLSTKPSADEAQAAINAVSSNQVVAGHLLPQIYVTNVAVGACKSSTITPTIVCDTRFKWEGNPINTRVAYWTTSNPRHPWRAQFVHTQRR